MGNIILAPVTERSLKEEHSYAKKLLDLEPLSANEKELLEKTALDQRVKKMMSLAAGFAMGISLKRYFPDARFVTNTKFFIMTVASIMLPCFFATTVITNREVIEQLHRLEVAHSYAEALERRRSKARNK